MGKFFSFLNFVHAPNQCKTAVRCPYAESERKSLTRIRIKTANFIRENEFFLPTDGLVHRRSPRHRGGLSSANRRRQTKRDLWGHVACTHRSCVELCRSVGAQASAEQPDRSMPVSSILASDCGRRRSREGRVDLPTLEQTALLHFQCGFPRPRCHNPPNTHAPNTRSTPLLTHPRARTGSACPDDQAPAPDSAWASRRSDAATHTRRPDNDAKARARRIR